MTMIRMKKILIRSFPLRLSLVILALVSLLFTLAFLGNSRSSRKYVMGESIERAQSALDNTILRINNVLQSVEVTIQNLSWLVTENLDDPHSLYSITEHIIESNGFISGSAIAFEPNYYEELGYFYSPYSYRENGAIKSIQLGRNEYNYHYMDWYQIPKLLDSPYWSEPYYDEGGGNTIMTTYSYPIYDQLGNMIAIFTADLSLEWFAEQVNSIKPYPNSYNIMIGRGGTFLVHKTKENILTETIFATARQTNDEEFIATAHKMVKGESGMGEFERQNQRFCFFYAPIKSTGWSVAVACLHSDIFSSVNNVRKYSYLLGLVSLFLMTIVCFMVIRRLTRPLTRIADAALEIAQGNLSTELPSITTHDEMRTLHDSFADMQHSLLNYIDELKRSTANKERIESELRIARAIQLGMVPKIFPPFPEREDIDLYARISPAREVGGDLYDFFINNEKLYFIIGDVSGKGVPASLVMAVTCRLFRTIASYTDTPEGIVTALNDALSETNESCMFCTVFVGVLDIRNGNLRYCNAGHNPPVILQPDGDVFTLNILPNIALGVWNGYEFKGESYNMQRGSALFMYTDGVTEAEDMDKSLYGEQRLLDLLRREDSRSARIITEHVVDDIARHAGDARQSDDITILCCSLDQLHTNDTRSLVMTNKIEEIERMTSFIEEICQENNLSVEDTFNIHLAVEEAVTNVIMYAYPQGEVHEFLLDVHVLENRLIFKIIDSGKEFDPTLQPDADVTLSLEERPIGGLGIFLIRQIMQTVDYRRVDGKNILTMVKMIN